VSTRRLAMNAQDETEEKLLAEEEKMKMRAYGCLVIAAMLTTLSQSER